MAYKLKSLIPSWDKKAIGSGEYEHICPKCGGIVWKGLCARVGCKPLFTNTIGDQMKNKTQQRFGRLQEQFGDFGELRKQKRAPFTEVLYIPVQATDANGINQYTKTNTPETVLRSVDNSTTDQILHHIRKVGANIEAGNLEQSRGEILLDRMYAELTKRTNAEA